MVDEDMVTGARALAAMSFTYFGQNQLGTTRQGLRILGQKYWYFIHLARVKNFREKIIAFDLKKIGMNKELSHPASHCWVPLTGTLSFHSGHNKVFEDWVPVY